MTQQRLVGHDLNMVQNNSQYFPFHEFPNKFIKYTFDKLLFLADIHSFTIILINKIFLLNNKLLLCRMSVWIQRDVLTLSLYLFNYFNKLT